MKLSRGLVVSSTNSNGKNEACVRVYKDGKLLATVAVNKRNPLGYLQSIVNGSKYLRELERELRQNTTWYKEDGVLTLEDWQVLQTEAKLKIHIS